MLGWHDLGCAGLGQVTPLLYALLVTASAVISLAGVCHRMGEVLPSLPARASSAIDVLPLLTPTRYGQGSMEFCTFRCYFLVYCTGDHLRASRQWTVRECCKLRMVPA